MYRNNNHYWKKSFNTTNVEVVIDDPLQIVDTYITNSVYFNNIPIFDKTANAFVYQSDASGNASVVYQTQGTVIATGIPGDGAVTVDSEIGVIGAAIHTGPIGTSGGTGGTGDDGGFVGPPGPRECAELFNEFLRLFEKLKVYFRPGLLGTPLNGDLLRLADIGKYWLNALDKNHPLYEFFKCLIQQETGKGGILFESPLEYLRRILGDPDWTFPIGLPTGPFVPAIPFVPGIPTSPGGIDQWLETYPDLLQTFEKQLREALEKIKENRSNQDLLSQIPASCREKYLRAIDQLTKDFTELVYIIGLLLQLKKIFDELKNSPCWELLNLEEEFNRRQIGRFTTLGQFFAWVLKVLELLMNANLFDGIDPDTKPFNLSDIQSSILLDIRYGNIENRHDIALAEYTSWLNQPVESRSISPPIKRLFRAFDNPNMTDDDARQALLNTLIDNFTTDGYRGSAFENVDWNDIVLHLSIFIAQPTNSFIPPSWRTT